MSKFVYFNDTGKDVKIHPATKVHGTICDMSLIKPLEQRVFELPERTYAWVKQWDNGMLLVSPTRDDISDNNKPKHLGKYPIEFSFTTKTTGEEIVKFCKDILETPDLDVSVYGMLKVISEQAERHLEDKL